MLFTTTPGGTYFFQIAVLRNPDTWGSALDTMKNTAWITQSCPWISVSSGTNAMRTLRISEWLEKVEERERSLSIVEEKRVFREEGALEHDV